MGFFDILASPFVSIGNGIVIDPVYKSVIKPVYKSVLKPVYNSVIKPVGAAVGRVAGKALGTAEHMTDNALDFSEQFQKKNQDLVGGAQDAALSLEGLLKNPLVLIGGGVLALAVVSKI
jgi:hypothetical protein